MQNAGQMTIEETHPGLDSTGEGSAWMPSMKKSDKKLMKENGQDFNEENSQFSAQGNVVMW